MFFTSNERELRFVLVVMNILLRLLLLHSSLQHLTLMLKHTKEDGNYHCEYSSHVRLPPGCSKIYVLSSTPAPLAVGLPEGLMGNSEVGRVHGESQSFHSWDWGWIRD